MINTHQSHLPEVFNLAIIGGGAAGSILLLHLLENIKHPFSVVIFQKGHERAKGVAYSTQDPGHLLNVRAGRMSAYADKPDHFIEWLREQGEYPEILKGETEKDAFIPRYLYGKYLQATLEGALANKPEYFSVVWKNSFATALTDGDVYTIISDENETVKATDISICTGIEAPATLPGLSQLPPDARIHVNPWLEKLPEIDQKKDVLLIGTGLTMVDNALSLLNSGFSGTINALSKHGHLPMSHPANKPSVKTDPSLRLPGDLATLFNVIKNRIKTHPDPQGWEEPVLEDIRPYSQELWYNFSREEKQRFLRHLQHHWSKLRHRIPYSIHLQLQKAIQDGRLRLLNGKVKHVTIFKSHLKVSIISRYSQSSEIDVQRIFNCVGPVLDVSQSTNPFIKDLASKGILRNSASKLGPDATIDGQIIGSNGMVNDRITLLGPLMRGVVWEAVAVPEIRTGARSITEHLLKKRIPSQHVA